VRVQVIEGDPAKPVDDPDNVILKEWEVPVDPERSQQDNAFDITYEYTVDGILHIVVTDRQTGTVMLRDDISFGVTRDKTQLTALAQRVRKVLDGGSWEGDAGGATPALTRAEDPEVRRLLDRTRGKVIPFVGDAEGAELEALCGELERASGEDAERYREKLAQVLRQYAYLF